MALKDKTSLYDLVGDGPVGNMLTQQGQPFDLGMDSELHAGPDGPNPNPTSLIDVYSKAITENVSFLAPQIGDPVDQDLNGLPGPSFDLGQASTLQQDSLLSVYNGVQGGSPFTAGPVPLPGHFADLDGGLPPTGKYEYNGPEGGYF